MHLVMASSRTSDFDIHHVHAIVKDIITELYKDLSQYSNFEYCLRLLDYCAAVVVKVKILSDKPKPFAKMKFFISNNEELEFF